MIYLIYLIYNLYLDLDGVNHCSKHTLFGSFPQAYSLAAYKMGLGLNFACEAEDRGPRGLDPRNRLVYIRVIVMSMYLCIYVSMYLSLYMSVCLSV